jgi:hypothetical protein
MSKHNSPKISLRALLSDFAINVYNLAHYNVFPFMVNYAKQTQSQVGENKRKLLCNKYIRVFGQLVIQTKQSQTNPIQSQFKPKQTQFKPNSKPIYRKAKNESFYAAKKFYDRFCDFLTDFTTLKGANFSNEAEI